MEQKRKPDEPVDFRDSGEMEQSTAGQGRDSGDTEAAFEADAARELEDLRSSLEEAQDRMLRSQADLDNYRKRMARQLEDERRYAALPLVNDLLGVWDNLRRAIEAGEKSHDVDALLEGVKMTSQQFESVLERHHVTRIAALNEPFDPHQHQAIAQQPSADHPANTIVYETQPGFRLFDRVVRPSHVIVSTAAPVADGGGNSG